MGKAVAAPWNAEKILVVDPSTSTASAIDLPPGIDAGRYLAAPRDAEKILVVDPSTSTASAIDLPPGIDAGKAYKFVVIRSVGLGC